MGSKILIVEDEIDICALLAIKIEGMGHVVEHVDSGEKALALLNRQAYDLMVLDWMLPGLSGIEVAQLVRKMESMKSLAILMLTAKAEPEDIIEGLEAGADDYITKPFHGDVLKARISSLLRRFERDLKTSKGGSLGGGEREEIQIGSLRVSLKSYKAYLEGQALPLTPSEFKLLATMLEHRGRVLTRARLIQEIQGEGITVIGRTIDTHVFGLRKKLQNYGDIIETVRGIGYRVRDDLF